jgi:hypothetical protein
MRAYWPIFAKYLTVPVAQAKWRLPNGYFSGRKATDVGRGCTQQRFMILLSLKPDESRAWTINFD